MVFLKGGIPQRVTIWYLNGTPPQLNSRLWFINPGLTLELIFMMVDVDYKAIAMSFLKLAHIWKPRIGM